MTNLSKSETMSTEYCCTIVQIGEVKPIEGSDFLGVVIVEGREIVVRKDQTKEGDIMFYVSNECQLNQDFLYINSLYEDKTLNSNPEHKGYINKYGRIRMVKLRGVLSMGFLFGIDEMKAYCPDFDFKIEENIGMDFDTINGELFVKAYVPPVKEVRHSGTGKKDKATKFDKMIPGQFAFNYDTKQLQREITRIKPDDDVVISVKLHGTSAIFGNIQTKQPKWGGLYSKLFLKLPKFLQFTKIGYDFVYSSRTVIKNQFYNPNVTDGYYGTDVWAEYAEILKPYINEGFIIYGEIVGYVKDSNKYIQKSYDYGCKPGTSQLMIYRITENGEEYNISQVLNWTDSLIVNMKLNDDPNWNKIRPIDVLYEGSLTDKYPDLDLANHWHQNVLEKMKNDFGLEELEPLCRNKVPREGICLRINDDPVKECFKLKALAFLQKEAKDIDKGDTSDMEMMETYG